MRKLFRRSTEAKPKGIKPYVPAAIAFAAAFSLSAALSAQICRPFLEEARLSIEQSDQSMRQLLKMKGDIKERGTAVRRVIRRMPEMRAKILEQEMYARTLDMLLDEFASQAQVYRSGWISPEDPTIKGIASVSARMKRMLQYPSRYLSLETLFDFAARMEESHVTRPSFASRTIREILDSGEATPEEKARVLASLVISSGGDVRLFSARGRIFLLAEVLESADELDVAAIQLSLKDLARVVYGAEKDIHGMMGGKGYSVACDPGAQKAPGVIDPGMVKEAIPLGRFGPVDY